MKGFTHYIAGLAAASCLPGAAEAAASGNPLPLLAGGVSGILPDALDFKGARFFARHDMEIAPDPLDPDMQMVADGLACAIRHARSRGRTVRVRLRTVPLGADAWQVYRVEFDPQGGVKAALGPVTTTGGRPLEEREPDKAEAPTGGRLAIGYEAVVEVAILDGPMLTFEPLPDGRVRVDFIPWHRAWSHSLVVAAAAGAAVWPVAGWLTGLAVFAGWAAHALADQLGFMGSALFYPFSRKRMPGFQLARSIEALPNLSLVWFSALVLFWNLAQAGHPEVHVNGARLFALGMLPLGIAAVWKRCSKGDRVQESGVRVQE